MRAYRRKEWEEWFADACDYQAKYGNLLIPAVYETADGYKLGRWIERQRAMYNGVIASTLDTARIIALENIGMVWKLEYRSPWDYWMEQVRNYVETYGDLMVPKNYENGNFRLGYWICEQRKKYSKGLLTKAEIEELESYGMCWPEGERKPWENWYEYAKEYQKQFGDLLVPINYSTDDGNKLGIWISVQRERYARTHNRKALSSQQIEMLNDLGMVWDLNDVRDEKWNSMYALVERYVTENGRLPLWPRNILAPDGRNIPNWIGTQRTRLSQGKCTSSQREMLLKLGIAPWKEEKQEADSNRLYEQE